MLLEPNVMKINTTWKKICSSRIPLNYSVIGDILAWSLKLKRKPFLQWKCVEGGQTLGISIISVQKRYIALCSCSQHNVFPFFLPPLVLIIPFSNCSAAPFDGCSRQEDKTWKRWCAVSLPWLENMLHTLTQVLGVDRLVSGHQMLTLYVLLGLCVFHPRY